jgi:hypothetical protein
VNATFPEFSYPMFSKMMTSETLSNELRGAPVASG